MATPFYHDASGYKRKISLVRTYCEDGAWYLHKMEGVPFDDGLKYMMDNIKPDGAFPLQDKKILMLDRPDREDIYPKEYSLLEYMKDVVKNNWLLAPTMTTYLQHSECLSPQVGFITDNIKERSVAKKAGLEAKLKKQWGVFAIKHAQQNNRKLANNALSGAYASPSTPLVNPTAHSTLTSNCRSTAGYGNANNEKFLAGNRHYWSRRIVVNNILSITGRFDKVEFQAVMDKYQLHYPTPEETLALITYSSDLYWIDNREEAKIWELVQALSPLERAAFAYIGDFYHLRKFNPDIIRVFLTKLSSKATTTIGDIDAVKKTFHEDNICLGMMIFADQIRGKEFWEASKSEHGDAVVATVQNTHLVVDEYADLISCMWRTQHVPASVAYFPYSQRRVVVAGDTDSTIFTTQEWVEWYCGSIQFDHVAYVLSAAVIYLTAQTCTHTLAIMSANFGIEDSRKFDIAMKNEYKFDLFAMTPVSKHYFAVRSAQEGKIFVELEKEIKGVQLKNSNLAKDVIAEAQSIMMDLMHGIMEGKQISLFALQGRMVAKEKQVYDAIVRGMPKYSKRNVIKHHTGYTQSQEQSNYRHYTFWQEVFAEKYGNCPPPPFVAAKFKVDMHTPGRFKAWLDTIQDQKIKQNVIDWAARYSRNKIATVWLPVDVIESLGVPKELEDVIKIREMVYEITYSFYLILKTLNIYLKNTNKFQHQLLIDHYDDLVPHIPIDPKAICVF
jgi:hypothetical protein